MELWSIHGVEHGGEDDPAARQVERPGVGGLEEVVAASQEEPGEDHGERRSGGGEGRLGCGPHPSPQPAQEVDPEEDRGKRHPLDFGGRGKGGGEADLHVCPPSQLLAGGEKGGEGGGQGEGHHPLRPARHEVADRIARDREADQGHPALDRAAADPRCLQGGASGEDDPPQEESRPELERRGVEAQGEAGGRGVEDGEEVRVVGMEAPVPGAAEPGGVDTAGEEGVLPFQPPVVDEVGGGDPERRGEEGEDEDREGGDAVPPADGQGCRSQLRPVLPLAPPGARSAFPPAGEPEEEEQAGGEHGAAPGYPDQGQGLQQEVPGDGPGEEGEDDPVRGAPIDGREELPETAPDEKEQEGENEKRQDRAHGPT